MSCIKLLTKDCVGGIHGNLVFCSISNQSLTICESYIAWSGSVSLVISDDFNFSMLEYTYTGVGGPEINTNSWSLGHGV